MPAQSAGILMYRCQQGSVAVLLVHPGGPFWAKKDLGSWSIPKGECGPNESAWAAAVREFAEETGVRPSGVPLPLGEVIQSRAKRITAFALKGELETSRIKSNVFHLEWPPKSGRMQSFPEVDRAEWFPIAIAKQKIVAGQKPLLDRLLQRIQI